MIINDTHVPIQNNINNELIKTKNVVISRKNFILFAVNNYKFSSFVNYTELSFTTNKLFRVI